MSRTTTDSRQFVFGPGTAYATLISYTDGTTPSLPQPRKVDVMQEVSLDFSMTAKPLFGQLIFPVAVGLGEGKVTGKIKSARFNSGLVSDIAFGQPGALSGGQTLIQDGEPHTVPSSPFTITVTPPNSGTFLSDLGVYYGDSGVQLTRAASASAAGIYSLSSATYTFNTADSAAPILISYRYTVTTGETMQINNLVQGAVSISSFDYQGQYAGRYIGVHLPYIVTGKFSLPTKEQDWIIGEMDFDAFANASNVVAYMYFIE